MLVSVVIPTYNRSLSVCDSIESALGQTYGNVEVIVVDDGSTDDTPAVLAGYGDRIRHVRQDNAGPSAARNRGFRESRGEIIAFLDSDDTWLPDKIERQVALMERGGPEMVCCVCNAKVLGVDGSDAGTTFGFASLSPGFTEGEWTNPQEVLATRFLLFNQVAAIRREAFEAVGGFNEDLRLLEDYELALKLSSAGAWGVICDPLVVKRNDTVGIGVEAMQDHAAHLVACSGVVRGLLESGAAFSSRTRRLLEIALGDMEWARIAHEWRARESTVSRTAGGALELSLKARSSFRRRLPSWPRFEGRAV